MVSKELTNIGLNFSFFVKLRRICSKLECGERRKVLKVTEAIDSSFSKTGKSVRF